MARHQHAGACISAEKLVCDIVEHTHDDSCFTKDILDEKVPLASGKNLSASSVICRISYAVISELVVNSGILIESFSTYCFGIVSVTVISVRSATKSLGSSQLSLVATLYPTAQSQIFISRCIKSGVSTNLSIHPDMVL